MNWSKKIGYTLLLLFVLVAVIAPLFLNHSPFSSMYDAYVSPSADNWLGTNHLGQDVFTQLIYGTRTTLMIGLFVAIISTGLSVGLGLLAGYSRRFDPLINGMGNMLIVIPPLLLIIIITSFTNGSLFQLILVLGCLTWAPYMRIIRSATLSLKEREFVKAAYLYGGNTFYILRKHIFLHVVPIMKTKFILSFRTAILTEAGLAFLGLGDANVISWGKMIHQGFSQNALFLTDAWKWVLLPPIALLIILTIAIVLISEEVHIKRNKNIQTKRQKREGNPLDSKYVLQCEEVDVKIGETTILKNLTFNMEYGKVVSIIGKSGSGKTTLGKAIYGLLQQEQVSGAIYVHQKPLYHDGIEISSMYWKEMSFMFQDPRTALHPLLTIEDQFYEVMDRDLSKEEKARTVKQSVEEVQLAPSVLTKYPHELSGGMLNRVMIALAFLHKPKLIIADEAMSGLDPLMKKTIVHLLKEKVEEHHTALLFITHDLDVAHYISDEVIELDQGKMIDRRDTVARS